MTLWQRFCTWFAKPDPMDTDSRFEAEGTQPVPSGMTVPSEDTCKRMFADVPPPPLKKE